MTFIWLLFVWTCAHPGSQPGRAWGECYQVRQEPHQTLAECRREAVAIETADPKAHAFCRRHRDGGE
jgi:hypothetical protein